MTRGIILYYVEDCLPISKYPEKEYCHEKTNQNSAQCLFAYRRLVSSQHVYQAKGVRCRRR